MSKAGWVLLDEDQEPEDLKECDVWWLPHVLHQSGFCPSSSQARKLIKDGAVRIDGEKVDFVDAYLQTGRTYVIKVGRNYKRVTLEQYEKSIET